VPCQPLNKHPLHLQYHENAAWICDILDDLCKMAEAERTIENMQKLDSVLTVKEKVLALCKRFPVYS